MKALKNTSPQTIVAYIKQFDLTTQKILDKIYSGLKKQIPNASEAIKYGMPTFVVNGKNLLHFAAYEKHIGFYPTPEPIVKFKKELLKYKTSKGAIQFPLDQPMPYELIKKITAFRTKQVM